MTNYYAPVLFIGSTDTIIELSGSSSGADPTQTKSADGLALDATATDASTETTETTTETVLADDELYLSRVYADKTISDCYSMLVSIRNCVLLLCMIIFLFEAHKILKNAFKRHYKS